MIVLVANALLVGVPMASVLVVALRLGIGLGPRARHRIGVAGCVFVATIPLVPLPTLGHVALHGPAPVAGVPSALAALLWIAIATLLLVREWRRLRALRRLSAGWTPLPGVWRKALGIPQPIVAWTGEGGGGPMSLPSLLGELYFPASELRDRTPEVLRLIVAHELDHVRWRDALAGLTLRMLRAVFWFSPGVWWLVAWTDRERELAADAAALHAADPETRLGYAEALVEIMGRRGLPVSAAGEAGTQRVEQILEPRRMPRGRGLVFAALLAGAVPVLPFLLPRFRPDDNRVRVIALQSRFVVRDVQRVVVHIPSSGSWRSR